jgi:hypothetical protein
MAIAYLNLWGRHTHFSTGMSKFGSNWPNDVRKKTDRRLQPSTSDGKRYTVNWDILAVFCQNVFV